MIEPVDVPVPYGSATLDLTTPTQSGSRTGLSAKELPASLEILDGRAVEKRGDTQVVDAVSRTTGLTVSPTPGNGGLSFSSRGFAGSNSVAVAEDGVRIQTASGTINYPSNTWGYERFEVVRGPASVVLGSGTVGATINAIRKEPTRESRQEILLGLGTDGYKRIGAGASGALGEITSYRVDVYGFHNEGWHDLGESRGGKWMSALRLQPNSDLRFNLIADYNLNRPDRYYGIPWGNNRRLVKSLKDESYNTRDSIIRYEDVRLRAQADWRVNDWLSVNNELYYLEAERIWRNIERYSLIDPNTVERSDYLYIRHDLEQTGNRLEAAVKGANHRAVFGWEAARVDFRHTNNSPYGGFSVVSASNPVHGYWESPDPTRPSVDTESTFNAFYVEDAWKFHDRWQLLAGIRRDLSKISRKNLISPGSGEYSNQKINGTAWRVGLTHFLTPSTSLYAQYSAGHDPLTGLISANLTQVKYRLTTGRQVEAGIKQTLPNGLGEWTAAVFRIEKKDILTRDPNNSSLTVQGGEQRSQGIELAAAISPIRNWRFEGNYTWLAARFDELLEVTGGASVSRAGNRPSMVARQTANLWGHYRLADWEGSLGLRYVGKRYTDNANTNIIPAYTVADASLSWQYSSSTTFRLIARNLADKVYAITTSNTQYVLGEPRRFDLVAEFRF